jgi:hypothetical protein
MSTVLDSSSFAPVLTLTHRTCLHSAASFLAVSISCHVIAVLYSETLIYQLNFTVFMFVTLISCYMERSVLSAVSRNRGGSWNALPVNTGAHLYSQADG